VLTGTHVDALGRFARRRLRRWSCVVRLCSGRAHGRARALHWPWHLPWHGWPHLWRHGHCRPGRLRESQVPALWVRHGLHAMYVGLSRMVMGVLRAWWECTDWGLLHVGRPGSTARWPLTGPCLHTRRDPSRFTRFASSSI
jgi:hypothetical protein